MKLIFTFFLSLCLCSCTISGNDIRGDIVLDIKSQNSNSHARFPSSFDSIRLHSRDFPDTVTFIAEQGGEIFDGIDEFAPFVDKFLDGLITGQCTTLKKLSPVGISTPQSFFGAERAFYTRFVLKNSPKDVIRAVKSSTHGHYAVTVCTRAKTNGTFSNVYSLWLLTVARDSQNKPYVKQFEMQKI